MRFVVRMALREIRASGQRLLFFFVCIAVGVASIDAISSVIQSARVALTREARAMTGGDLVVAANVPFTAPVRQAIEGVSHQGAITTTTETLEVATMVRPANAALSIT
jgi:putative ABC transport system permease protein